LRTEGDGAGFCVHRIDNGKGLQLIAQIADHIAADLEALFNDDAQTFDGSPGIPGNGDQPLQCAAVCQKIVDDQKPVVFVQKLSGDDYLVAVFVGEGVYLGYIHIAFNIDRLGFLGKHHGNAKFLCHKGGNADAGGLNGHDLGDGLVRKAALELPADLLHQCDIHLVIQEAVHLQNVAGLYNAVLHNSLFQKVHDALSLHDNPPRPADVYWSISYHKSGKK